MRFSTPLFFPPPHMAASEISVVSVTKICGSQTLFDFQSPCLGLFAFPKDPPALETVRKAISLRREKSIGEQKAARRVLRNASSDVHETP